MKSDEYDSEHEGAERPSKSSRKRAAHAVQDLGEQLVALRDSELTALNLPESLVEAIREARRMRSRAASSRQRQYIGRLMRDIDPDPIRAALAARGEHSAREAERFKRLEEWRTRLIEGGPEELQELMRWRANLDGKQWTTLVNAAQREHARSGATGPAARELFRALRALFEGEP